MITLPLQWEKHSGPDSVGQHKLIFTMDESINHGEFNPLSLKKGTQFLVMMIEADSTEANEFINESKDETLNRFRRQMHAIIGEIADAKGTTPEKEKERVKTKLIAEGHIENSTMELDIEGLASLIIRLKKYRNDTLDKKGRN